MFFWCVHLCCYSIAGCIVVCIVTFAVKSVKIENRAVFCLPFHHFTLTITTVDSCFCAVIWYVVVFFDVFQ